VRYLHSYKIFAEAVLALIDCGVCLSLEELEAEAEKENLVNKLVEKAKKVDPDRAHYWFKNIEPSDLKEMEELLGRAAPYLGKRLGFENNGLAVIVMTILEELKW